MAVVTKAAVLNKGYMAPMEKRGYWELKGEALDHTVWRTCFGQG
jgi:hypothetical protein